MYEIDDIDDSSDEEGNKKEPKGITLYHIFNNKFLTRFFNTDNFWNNQNFKKNFVLKLQQFCVNKILLKKSNILC